MDVTIAQERPDTQDSRDLIFELDAYLNPLYPPSSQHGLSVDRLLAEEVAFFVLRDDGAPAGCGGVKFYDSEWAEIKRMYVRPAFRGRGFGKVILTRLEEHAAKHGIAVLRLETGISQPEAIGLYERLGYRTVEAFAPYMPDPLCLYYEKKLTG